MRAYHKRATRAAFGLSPSRGAPANRLRSPSRMMAGESLRPQISHKNELVTSPSGKTELAFQTDGNIVLRSGKKVLWSSGTNQSEMSRLTMQSDGNLVLYDNSSHPRWASDTNRFHGSHLEVVDSDARLIGPQGSIVWSAVQDAAHRISRRKQTPGFHLKSVPVIGSAVTWVGNAVKTSGRALGTISHAIADEEGKIGRALSKIPVVGGLLHGLFDAGMFGLTGPIIMTGQIAAGERVDRVVLAQLKAQLRDFKEVGPYAQMVFSFIPGVGTVIAAALGCGLALANGQPIGAALVAGVEGAVPGGPLAKAAFDIAANSISAAASHTKITWDWVAREGISAAATAVALPDEAKRALEAGFGCATALIQGKRVDKSLISNFENALPLSPQAKNAVGDILDLADRLATGQKVDKAVLAEATKLASVLPISPAAQKAITAGVQVGAASVSLAESASKKSGKGKAKTSNPNSAQALATGEVQMTAEQSMDVAIQHAVTDMYLDAGKKHLSKPAVDAMQVSLAMQHAQHLQSITGPELQGPVTSKLQAAGQRLIKRDPVVAAAYSSAIKTSGGQVGFQVGAGLMTFRANVHQVMSVRAGLSPDDQNGFDIAVSLHIGRVSTPTPDVSDVTAQAAAYATHGMQGGYPAQKMAQMQAIASHPVARVGAEHALQKIARSRESWWDRLLEFLGLRPQPFEQAA